MTTLIRLVETKKDFSPEDLKAIIRNIAFYDKRALNIKGLMVEVVKESKPSDGEILQALNLLTEWDNLRLDTDGDGFYEQPGTAIYDR